MANTFTAEEAAALRARGVGVAPLVPPSAPPAAKTQESPPPAASAPAEPSPPDASGTADATAAVTETVDPATTDTAPAGDDTNAPVEEASATSEAAPKGKNSASARIQELIEERNALRAYGRHLEGRLAEAPRPAAPAAPAAAPAPVAPTDPPPKLEDFKFNAAEHAKALGEWTQKQIDARVNAGIEARLAAQRVQTSREVFEKRVDAFRATTPDFDTVISNPNLPNLHERAAARVVNHEKGPQIAYYLAKNPDVAVRIARQDADSQLVALGRIEASLSAPASTQKPAAPAATRAPAPPKPVPSGGSPGKDPNSPSASMQEFVQQHRAKLRRPSRGR